MIRIILLYYLIKLKKIWGVSLAALNYRLHHVGILTEWNCRNNWLQMAQRGFRVSEPEPLPDTARERSQIADKVVALLHQEKRTLSDIAKVLQVRKRDLALLMFNAEPSVVTTNAATAPKTSKPCGALRLIQI